MTTSPKTYDFATFGEAMMMLIADRPGALELTETFSKRIAGAEINVAMGIARLGFNTHWASRLGADSIGRYLIKHMRSEGVNCDRVVQDPKQTSGFLFKGRVEDGSDPEVEYHRKGSAASQFQPQEIDEPWLREAKHLHATGVFPAISTSALATAKRVMQIAREAGSTISFDPNLRPSLWSSKEVMRAEINQLAAMADWVLPGLAEGQLLTGYDTPEEIAAFYRKQGASLVTVKLGAQGAYFDDAKLGTGYVAGCPVDKVVDTVGAGDAFAVGVISGMLDGLDLHATIRRACWIGARQVQVLGDSEGLPTRAELQAAGY